MKEFEPTIEWLKSALPEKYAEEIPDNWCWSQLGRYYREHDVPKEIIEPIVRAIIESGDAGACFLYCLYIENREDLVNVIRQSGGARVCFLYCRDIENREDLVDVIRESGDAWACYRYCRDIENREDLVDVIRESGDADACYEYCLHIENREDLVDVIRKSGNAWSLLQRLPGRGEPPEVLHPAAPAVRDSSLTDR